MARDSTFTVNFNELYLGQAPVAHLNTLTEIGKASHYSTAQNVDILTPGLLTQGPALADLTNGSQGGVVSELINFIMDKAVAANQTYGIGVTKLFRITPTTVTNTGNFPHTITNATDGESCIDLGGNLYYFYNKSSGGDIGQFNLSSTFIDNWGSDIPVGKGALQKAVHPVATKEDLMLFGNGRYAGLYTDGSSLALTKLDFGIGREVADVIFHANQWYLAVNSGVSGTNRNVSQVYLYDGSAVSSILSDEVAVGVQRIGFLYPLNGVIFIAYQDLSSTGGYKIGFISGRQIKPLRYFTGSLPNFAQKTLFKNTILFISSSSVYSIGAVVEQLPIQLSQLADGGHATIGALAAPFGTPMVASTDDGSNHRLAKFSGFDTSCNWKSIIIPVSSGAALGYIDEIVVLTTTLSANARCDLVVEVNQAATTGTVQQITTTGRRRHSFKNLGVRAIEDFRIALTWANGNAANDCPIRSVSVRGHFVEQ